MCNVPHLIWDRVEIDGLPPAHIGCTAHAVIIGRVNVVTMEELNTAGGQAPKPIMGLTLSNLRDTMCVSDRM